MTGISLPYAPLRRHLRLLLEIPLVFVVVALSCALLPLTLPLALLADLVMRRRLALTRMLLMLQADAVAEAVALVAIGLVDLRYLGRCGSPGHVAAGYAVGVAWARSLFAAAEHLYGLRFETHGLDLADPGPLLVLPRHVSIADTLLPTVLLHPLHGLLPRYVVKQQLELDPVLDLFAHRVPAAFVQRGGRDPEGDRRRIARLCEDLHPHDMIVIFPEGTRFTPDKQAHLARRAAEKGDAALAARVERFPHTLPPHPGGVLTVLEHAPDLDLLFIAQTGFDGLLKMRDLLGGVLIGRTIRVQAWRVPASEVPEEGRAAWLDDQWARVDAWVGVHQPG